MASAPQHDHRWAKHATTKVTWLANEALPRRATEAKGSERIAAVTLQGEVANKPIAVTQRPRSGAGW